jgi:hypothetical protein
MVVQKILMGEGYNTHRLSKPLSPSSALKHRAALSRKGKGHDNAHRARGEHRRRNTLRRRYALPPYKPFRPTGYALSRAIHQSVTAGTYGGRGPWDEVGPRRTP